MTPSSLSVPTDNIFKFSCLFGLALIISSILAFVAIYTSSRDKKIEYLKVIISLEGQSKRTSAEEQLLTMNRKLIDVSKSDENFGLISTGVLLGCGLILSFNGAWRWYRDIQPRDNRLAQLQIEKLEVEIAKLRAEVGKAEGSFTNPEKGKDGG